jgi:hypothetical protein
MPPAATIPDAPASPSTLAPCLACPRSGSPPGHWSPRAPGPRSTRCDGTAAAGWRGGRLLGPDPSGRQAGGRPCRLADRSRRCGQGRAGRDPSYSDPRAPAPRPHAGPNPAGAPALNACDARCRPCCSHPRICGADWSRGRHGGAANCSWRLSSAISRMGCSEVARRFPPAMGSAPWEVAGNVCLDSVAGRRDGPGQSHRPGGDVAGNGPFPALTGLGQALRLRVWEGNSSSRNWP